jgi:DNA uptake protein ComE-like DNA-binding protein
MIRLRSVASLLVALALCVSSATYAQTKETPTKTTRKAGVKPLDINSASEDEITTAGIDKTIAKKIVQGRPYRNKTELVSRLILTRDQYDKLKDSLVAKQPSKTKMK